MCYTQIVLKQNKGKLDKISIISLVVGIFLVLLLLQFKEPTTINGLRTEFSLSYYFKLFLCGIVGAGAMIIPGISGSMLLLILGEYYNILSFINGIKIMPLIFVGIGIILGIVLCSKLISYLFEHYRNGTIYFILGLILSSILGSLSNARAAVPCPLSKIVWIFWGNAVTFVPFIALFIILVLSDYMLL